MDTNFMQEPFFGQNFAFSTNYLDYEIPDFRGSIKAAIPLNTSTLGAVEVLKGKRIKTVPPEEAIDFLQQYIDTGVHFVCMDSVSLHVNLMNRHGDSESARRVIWSLTDHNLLWDIILLEQRIAWATTGCFINVADAAQRLMSYNVGQASRLERFRVILQQQFDNLIDNFPFLKNDIAGRRIFDTAPPRRK